MGIGVYAELGGINTLTTWDSIIAMYAVFGQAEGQEHSDVIKFGIRRRMRSGKEILNHSQLLDDTKGRMRCCVLCRRKRKLCARYLQGNGVRRGKRYLGGTESRR